MPVMSMLDAAQVTAWATLALAILALLAAIVAGAAWRVQARQLAALRETNARQLPVLDGQAEELKVAVALRQREERERHAQFVTRVFCWQYLGPERRLSAAGKAAGLTPVTLCTTYVRNAGSVPVYDVAFARWVAGELVLWSEGVAPLMPAMHIDSAEPAAHWDSSTLQWGWQVPDDTDPETIEVAVFIRDAAGNRWRLRPGGYYDEFHDIMLPPGATWNTT